MLGAVPNPFAEVTKGNELKEAEEASEFCDDSQGFDVTRALTSEPRRLRTPVLPMLLVRTGGGDP